MRKAMADAEVGDDGYGEDPTVNRLESMFAERVGMESAVIVPSGTMANQLALWILAAPGDLVLAGRRQHVVLYEAGVSACNAQVQLHLLDDDDGTVAPTDIESAIDAGAHHQPAPRALFIEHTHMPAGGVAWPTDRLDAVAVCGLPIHLDGARAFNAEVATGVPVAEVAKRATTMMTCLSKGLCAPVGSLLAGPEDLVARARIERKRLGGSMRQAGVIAAAASLPLRR